MSNKKSIIPIPSATDNPELEARLVALTDELKALKDKISAFQTLIRTHLADELIVVQELTVLYKQQKEAKKLQRLEQQKRGKNYAAPTGLTTVPKQRENDPAEQHEKKRLYREAMLQVHPDKFMLQAEQIDLATEVTAKLIAIYEEDDLAMLQAFHAHIFNGNVLSIAVLPTTGVQDNNYLQLQLQRLEAELADTKNSEIYALCQQHEAPMPFIAELKIYYLDRISKLRKRTRTTSFKDGNSL